jgi:hypothetical protein
LAFLATANLSAIGAVQVIAALLILVGAQTRLLLACLSGTALPLLRLLTAIAALFLLAALIFLEALLPLLPLAVLLPLLALLPLLGLLAAVFAATAALLLLALRSARTGSILRTILLILGHVAFLFHGSARERGFCPGAGYPKDVRPSADVPAWPPRLNPDQQLGFPLGWAPRG